MNNKDKNPNVPNLRFPEYSIPWKECSLGDVLTICHGKDYKHLNKGKYPVLGTSGIFEYVDDYLCDWPCAMIGRKGATLDKPHFMDKPFWCVDTLYYSKPHINQNPKWQYYLFQTIDWMKMNESSGIPSLRSSTIESLKINVPDINEQNKIVKFLDKIDQRIELQNKIIEDLKLQKEYIIQEIFKDIDNDNKILLSDVLIDYSEKTIYNNQFPVLSSTASGMYFQNEYFNKEAASEDTTGYKIVPKGYCTYRSMSDTGVFNFNQQNLIDYGIVSPAYPVFYSNSYDVAFIALYLNKAENIKKKILQLKTGGTRFALSFKSLCNLSIPDITKEKQQSIMNMIAAFEKKINNEKQIQQNMIVQKQYLLNNMFI